MKVSSTPELAATSIVPMFLTESMTVADCGLACRRAVMRPSSQTPSKRWKFQPMFMDLES